MGDNWDCWGPTSEGEEEKTRKNCSIPMKYGICEAGPCGGEK